MKVVTAAIAAAALILLASPAGADVVGTMSTQLADGCWAASFTTDYTCQADGRIAFTFTGGSSGSGTGTLAPSSGGDNTFSFSGANDGVGYDYVGTYADTGTWLVANAVLMAVATGEGGAVYPGVTGRFSGIPTCATAEPAKDNHGQYVSGAAKTGVTGKALAATATNVALVGSHRGWHPASPPQAGRGLWPGTQGWLPTPTAPTPVKHETRKSCSVGLVDLVGRSGVGAGGLAFGVGASMWTTGIPHMRW